MAAYSAGIGCLHSSLPKSCPDCNDIIENEIKHLEQLLDEYKRMRWRIELLFKRLKSLARIGHVPKHDDRSSRAWLCGKLLIALLTQKLIRIGRDISPWSHAGSPWRAT